MNVANVALAQGAIARHRDVVVGVKARLSENVADANDLEALRRAQEAAAPRGAAYYYATNYGTYGYSPDLKDIVEGTPCRDSRAAILE